MISIPSRAKFLHDIDNRILKLFYDIDIKTIFKWSKLKNIKKKYWKYAKFLTDVYFETIQPPMLEFHRLRENAYQDWQRAKQESFKHNPPENEEFRNRVISIYNEAHDEYESMRLVEQSYNEDIRRIQHKIKEINNHQKEIRYYKKCAHCYKMKKVTTSGCYSRHKLCYDCIYDKSKCPVCNEDIGIVHCDICYLYKKELVNTGCKNKHQTCKVCLGKIIRKNNLCPFCRETCSKNQPAVVPINVEGTQHTVEEMEEMDESYFASSRIMSYR